MQQPFDQKLLAERLKNIKYPVHELISSRWSPRAMTGEELSDAELFSLFEAARWAPSSYNNQPWRFLYAKRGSPEWPLFFDLMVDFNKSWAKNAATLVLAVSANLFERNGKPARTHSFDTGAAWMSLAIEACARGYVAHGMEGFNYALAEKSLEIPPDHTVEALIAIGKRATSDTLSPELREREAPSPRKPLETRFFKGRFPKKST